ncbi:MAG: hypothetical protein KatS3mg115_1766 [Candidatus Poribacteria bacterium]|nr:MAG: hypothetical protein KatS3mg115_1766 [Candidatus Poribacteria bacterium]
MIRAVREKIGPERTLLIDANNGYTPEEAQEVILQTEDCRLEWIEEPFPEEKEACLAFKRFLQERGKNILLADGEGATSQPEAFTEIVRAGGIDVVQFDMRAYTLTRWARYRSVLEETGALAAPHNWGSHLSGFYVAHFGRACPQFATDEIDPMEMPGVIAEGYRMQAGRLVVPEAPGFGLRLDPETYQVALRQPEAWSVAA